MLSLMLFACTSGTPAPGDDTQSIDDTNPDTGDASVDPYLGAITWQSDCVSPGAECGVLQVPVDVADPDGPTIEIAIARVRASGGAAQGTLFVGIGPVTVAQAALASTAAAYLLPDAAEVFDVVMMDPRGTHGSQALGCGAVVEDAIRSAPTAEGQAGVEHLLAWQGQIADACAADQPELFDHMGPAHRADDLDLVRRALGEETLHLYVESYAAPLAVHYAHAYPEHTGRVLFDTPAPVMSGMSGLVDTQSATLERLIDDWAAWCAQAPGDCLVSDDPMGALNGVYDALDQGTALADGAPVPWAHAFWSVLFMVAADGGEIELGDALRDAQRDGDYSGLASGGAGYFDGRGDGLAAFYLSQCSSEVDPSDTDDLVARSQAEYNTPFLAQFDVLSRGMCTALGPMQGARASELQVSLTEPAMIFQATQSVWEPQAIGQALHAQFDHASLVLWESGGATGLAGSPCLYGIGTEYLISGTVPNDGTVCDR